MDFRRARQTLVAVLLALVGVPALGGSALHALPGLAHARPDVAPGDRPDDDLAAPDDDCPVCSLLAQAPLAGPRCLIPSPEGVAPGPVAEVAPAAVPAPALPSAPRGPPLA